MLRKIKSPLTISRPELQIHGSDKEFRALVHGMLAFAARLEAVRSGFGAIVGLTGIQYTILISVNHLEERGGVSISTISEHLHVSGPFVTIETNKLLRLGLLTKQQDRKDRRRVLLSVTRKGYDLLVKLAPIQVQVNNVLFGFLDAAQFRNLYAMLDRVTSCGDHAVTLLDYLAKGGSDAGTRGRKVPASKIVRRMEELL